MATYTITWNGRKININGLPDKPVRNWDNNIKIKFYHRGKIQPTQNYKNWKV